MRVDLQQLMRSFSKWLNIDTIKIYNTSLDSGSYETPLPKRLVNHLTVVYNKDVYVISGNANCETSRRRRHLEVLYNAYIYIFYNSKNTVNPEYTKRYMDNDRGGFI